MDTVAAVWTQLESFALGSGAVTALRIAVIAIVSWLAIALLQRSIRALRVRIAARLDDPEAVKRAETLGRVFRYIAAIVVGTVGAMLVLSELGVSLAPILGAAGVVGVAVGFGAQSLVKDFFSGFFILFATLTTRKITKATIRKSITVFRNKP